jgi:glycosyltransferase involved in cell wall biosynthesis
MHVLFASGIDGFCHRYAVLHWVEQLATQGIQGTVRAHVDPRLAADLATHDLLVLYRVPFSAWIAHLLGAARALGRATMFAVDDLIVSSTMADPAPLRRRTAEERAAWHDGVRRYRETMRACDVFLGTTPPLVEVARVAGKPAYLHRCGLGIGELRQATRARAAAGVRSARRPGAPRLGYFSGTPTHDDDFATVAPVLLELLEHRTDLELAIGGTLTRDARFARFDRRVRLHAWVPWTALPTLIAATDVNLAPLEWQDPFVAAKGAVKYLEAAAVGVPTVASPTEAFRHAIIHGETGMLAADASEWRAALVALLDDRARAARLGAAARVDVEARFTPVTQGRALAAIVREVVGRASHEASRKAPGPLDEPALARAFAGEVARAAREPSALPDLVAPDVRTTTPPLGDATVLSQEFDATLAGLIRVDVHGVTFGQRLDHVVALRVRRADGTAIADETCPAQLVPDRDWLAVEFPAEPDSAGRRYSIELEAKGTGTGNALSFGTTAPDARRPPYTLAGIAGDAALALRTFATGNGLGA